MFGPNFANEIMAAGLGGLPFSWGDDGLVFGREKLTAAQNTTLDQVIAAHDPKKPARRLVRKSLVLDRLTDDQLNTALAILTPRQKERWRAPDHPAVYSDDPETIQLLQAVGADPAVVLAPE